MAEAEVFKFDLEAIDAEPVRDRGVYIESLACDACFLRGRHRIESLHIVQSIRELDENDANVLDHREHHLAEALGLGLGTAAELNLVELADAIDEYCDFAAELVFDVGDRRFGVFDDVVQDRSANCLRIEVHPGELLRNGDRVRNVGLAGLAGLTVMCCSAKLVGVHDGLYLLFGEVGLQRFDELPQPVVALRCARKFG